VSRFDLGCGVLRSLGRSGLALITINAAFTNPASLFFRTGMVPDRQNDPECTASLGKLSLSDRFRHMTV